MTVTLKVSIKEYKDMIIAGKNEISFDKTKNLHADFAERVLEDEDRGMEL